MGSHHPIRKTVAPEPTVIPDKLYFRIGDVARLCQVPAYVLRFWETEFPSLKPNKGGTGQRLYRKRDVEMALRIKSLLYDEGYTIPGARQIFKAEAKAREASGAAPASEAQPAAAAPMAATGLPSDAPGIVDQGEQIRRHAQQQPQLQALRQELLDLLAMLSAPGARQQPPAAFEPEPARTLRPRLVLEPRPASARASQAPAARPNPLQVQQRDLFALEPSESPE
jgi:DNA-binding transcriptional MerR regulator